MDSQEIYSYGSMCITDEAETVFVNSDGLSIEHVDRKWGSSAISEAIRKGNQAMSM